MVLFSFYVEVFVENACVGIRAYVCSCSVHLIVCCVHCYAVRLIIAFVDVNKTYLILSYLILSYFCTGKRRIMSILIANKNASHMESIVCRHLPCNSAAQVSAPVV